jgi:hypothetical protein
METSEVVHLVYISVEMKVDRTGNKKVVYWAV